MATLTSHNDAVDLLIRTECSADIRCVAEKDAEAFLKLQAALDSETAFLLFDEGERSTDIELQRTRFRMMQNGGNQKVFVATTKEKLIGYIGATRGTLRRNTHCASISIAVLSDWWGQGVASRLMVSLENWAISAKIVRLELTVQNSNVAARSLYEKFGFSKEGERQSSLRIGGQYLDELYMGKLLRR